MLIRIETKAGHGRVSPPPKFLMKLLIKWDFFLKIWA